MFHAFFSLSPHTHILIYSSLPPCFFFLFAEDLLVLTPRKILEKKKILSCVKFDSALQLESDLKKK